ncbi:MAG: BF3164 family lipoprotein [Bacteroidota bacterium]
MCRKKYLPIVCFVLSFSLFSCVNELKEQRASSDVSSPKEVEVRFTGFQEEKSIVLPEEGFDFIGNPTALLSTQDYLLVLDTYNAPHLTILKKDDLTLLGKMIFEGKGPGEALNPGKMIRAKRSNSFWLFDGLMQRLQLFDVEAALAALEAEEVYDPPRIVLLKDSLRGSVDPDLISDSLFVTTTFTFDDCRFFCFDQAPQLIAKVGVLPPSLSEWPEQGVKAYFPIAPMYYQAKLATHPLKNWVAVGYFDTDVLEIYKNEVLTRRITGPEGFEIEKQIVEQAEGIYAAIGTSETKEAYLRMQANEDFIYTLFIGTVDNRRNRIHIFDWEGRPVQKLLFNHELGGFYMEKQGEDTYMLYVSDQETGKVGKIPLTF